MKKRGREDDEIVFGVDGTPNAFALALAKTPSGLHANLLDFFREKTSLPCVLAAETSGPYLEYPEESRKALQLLETLLSGFDESELDLSHVFGGMCEPIGN